MPYKISPHKLANLRAAFFQQWENDAHIGGHDEGHIHVLRKSKYVQEILKVMINQLEDQVSYCMVLPSAISNFLTLLTSSTGALGLLFFPGLLA